MGYASIAPIGLALISPMMLFVGTAITGVSLMVKKIVDTRKSNKDSEYLIEGFLKTYGSKVYFIENLKLLIPELKAMNFDFHKVILWLDAGLSTSKILDHLTSAITRKFMSVNAKMAPIRSIQNAWSDKEELIQVLKSPREFLVENFENYIKDFYPSIKGKRSTTLKFVVFQSQIEVNSFWNKRYRYSKPYLFKLFKIKSLIRTLTPDFVLRYYSGVTKAELLRTLGDFKIGLEQIVDDFVFDSQWSRLYVAEEDLDGSIFFKPDYDFYFDMYYAYYRYKGKFPGSEADIQNAFGYGREVLNGNSLLAGKSNYLWSTYRSILEHASDMEFKYHLYKGEGEISFDVPFEIVESVQRFKDARNIHYNIKRGYSHNWDNPFVIKAHVTALAIRSAFTDLSNLDPIHPFAFRGIPGGYVYQRDHLYLNDKLSTDINRIWLTMNANHPTAETIPLNVKLDMISESIKDSKTMNPYYRRVSNYGAKWSNYLGRVDYIREHGVGAAIRNYLTYRNPVTGKEVNYFLNRFYKGVPKGQLETEIKKVFQEWVDRGYPMFKLPSYAQRLLPSHRQMTLTNYLGNSP
ncbi:hypothetical protein ES705_14005 [subsurface metagenome]